MRNQLKMGMGKLLFKHVYEHKESVVIEDDECQLFSHTNVD